MTKISTANPEAYQLYLKVGINGTSERANRSNKRSSFIDQAIKRIRITPSPIPAWPKVMCCFRITASRSPLDSMPKAKAAALRAIELDDSLAETHTALGIYYSNFAWNQPAAEKEFRRAIELNPNYATAHQQFGIECLTATGRFDEAVAESRRAAELDPVSPIIARRSRQSPVQSSTI